MKKLYYQYLAICYLFLMLLGSAFTVNAQVRKAFSPRLSSYSLPDASTYHIKGNFTMIGNTNLTLQNYGDNTTNGTNPMVYVDKDTDSQTHNSSSAVLDLKSDNGTNLTTDCSKIVYAGLYWTGRVSDAGTSPTTFNVKKNNVTVAFDKRKILLKGGTGTTYDTFTALDSNIWFPTNADNNIYTAYAEVTDYVRAHGVGNYFAANIASTEGSDGGSIGKFAGWGMVVIYENSNMKNRDITVFDGHAFVQDQVTEDYIIPVTGFNSVATGAVGIKLGVMAGEGDVNYDGDYFQIEKLNSGTYQSLNHAGNITTNFFNSSIQTGGNVRNPNLKNNSGIDISMFDLPNSTKSLIGNNQTSTRFKYGSTIDTYAIFSIVMAVDAYVPEIEGTLTATTINNVAAGAAPYTVLPGQELGYKLQLKNRGTEAIQNTKIVIPIPYNTTFVPESLATNIKAGYPSVTNTFTFDPTLGANGSIVWDYGTLPLPINPDTANTVLAELTFKLKATEDCKLLKNSNCTNVIQVNGLMSGKGLTSTVNVTNKPFILGYTNGGNCNGVAISAPLETTIDAAAYINANCQATPPIIAFTFCSPGATVPVSAVSSSFPTGTTFYNAYPVISGTTQYTVNGTQFPATVGTNTYYAIPPGATGCFFQFTITVESITSVPTVVTPIKYCIGDVAAPLTAIPSKPGYILYYYADANPATIPQLSLNPSTSVAGQFTYYVAEGKTNSCIGPKTPIVVNINAKPTVVITTPKPICTSGNTLDLTAGAITAGSTSGLDYTYWTDANATIPSATAVGIGTYYIKGTNAAGCFDIKPVVVSKTTIVLTEITTSHVNVLCNGGATGSIAVNAATGGVGTIKYSWKKDGTAYAGDVTSLTNLGVGSYEVTATDANGCSEKLTIGITQPDELTATTSQTDVSCNAGTNGTATVTPAGGAGNYTYSWSPSGGTAATATGLKAGTYTVTITDKNSCTLTKTVEIIQPAVLTATTSQTYVSCNAGTNGTATVTPAGGAGNYTYLWSPSGGTAATATGLKAGTYTVTITDKNSCTLTKTVEIIQPAVLTATTSQTDVSCNAGTNGTATVTPAGGAGNYTYSWSPSGGTAATATGLKAGTYTVTITDKNSCTLTKTVEIIQPSVLTATTSQTDVSCNAGTNGTATVTPAGGAGNYTYSWSPSGGTAATATGLKAGTYTVTITDKNSCTLTKTVEIIQPSVLTATTSQTDVSCNAGTNGTATVTPAGGAGNYTYSWSPSGGTAATATGLKAGTYTVTITDKNSCTLTKTVEILQPSVLTATTSQTDVSCNAGTNGTATVTPAGGAGNYTYLWSPSGGTAATATGLKAGTYTVTITDKNSCTLTKTVEIIQPSVLTATTSQTDVSCNAGTNGTATVTPAGGAGNYTYSWSPSGGTAATATGLKAGTYTVTITDKNSCTLTKTVEIIQPSVLTATTSQTDVSCNAGTNGTATVTPAGGAGNYTYSWSPSGGTAATATGLKAGTYTVTITDKNSCTLTKTVEIIQPSVLTATTSQTNVGCGGAATGSASVVVSGGTSTYTYLWSPSGGTAATATGLIAGSYSVLITDANGCSLTKPFTILDGDSIKPIVNPLPETTTINCPAEPVFTQATATDDNGTIASLTHQDETIPGNCAGSKTVIRTWTATDACGNVSLPVSQTIIVQDITAPTWETASNSLDKTVECSDETALASAQALFPTASDTCDSDVKDVVKISGSFVASEGCSKTGTYTNTWTVKDDCGNTSETFTQVITIEDTTKPKFVEVPPAEITVSCDAVPAPAEMEASDNCSVDLPIVYSEVKSDIQNECNTNYTLTRKWTTSDCAGNEFSYTQIIKVQDTTAPTGTAPTDVADLQSIADIPVGSASDITDAADNCSTNINITVSDANNEGSGCEGSPYILIRTYTLTDCAGNETKLVRTFTVENKVSVSGVASNVTCFGSSDGSITVTNSAGSTVVITNANNEVVGNTNLPAGTYTLTATSSVNGEGQTCTATATVTITQPTYTIKISGQVINVDTNAPIANVPVTLIPQGTTTGPILFRLTGADGMYNFSGMVAGSYLVQVQDANLNSAYQLYPVNSSLFFTTLEDCKLQVHNFEYGKSDLPVLGDYVWYDTNGNGIQDEWYDANNDGVITKNIPDSNGAIDYSLWEWIDFNGDGSYTGPQNAGELNAGGFGNALSSNVIVDGPNGYHDEVIVGIQGYWRNRPDSANPYGQYTIKLVHDANFDAAAAALGATGLVKVIPSATDKKVTSKTAKAQMHTVCQTTTDGGYIVNVTPEDLVHLDIDFGVNCKELRDIVANDDTAGPIAGVNHTTTNVLNVLPNDTIEGVVVTASDVIITTVTPNEFLQLNPDGSVDVLPNAPVGTLTMVYQICEADQTSNCDTATVTVTIEAPVMTVTATAICVNDVPYVDYVVTPGNFTPVNGVTIAWADSNNNVITTMNNLPLSGRVLWPGAVVDQAGNGVDWPGWLFQNNKWIQGADGFEGLRPTATLTISVNPSQTIVVNYPPADPYCIARPTFAIVANDDTAGPISGNTGGTNVINVYTNDTLNGNPVNPADLTLTTVTPDPKGALTLNPDGSINVAPNTPTGTYVLTYQICENADFGNCDTAIVTINVVNTPPAPPALNAQADLYSVSCNGYGNVGNIFSNDTIDLGPALLSLLNFTLLPSSTGNPGISVDATGNVIVATTTPPGTYTYNYQICLKNYPDVCTTRSITITVQPNITNVTGTACNDDSTLIDLMTLLPEGAPRTGTWIDTNSTNALQGNIFNPFGLATGNYVFEYKIADQSCPRSVLVAMTVNNDCKVLACGNILVHNAFSPNGDGKNDVFTIDSIDEVTCYPENTVEIYNRWGILVFETSNYNNTTNAFDGTSRGRTTVNKSDGLPSGTYFYIINYKSLDGNNVLQSNKKDGYLYLSK